MVCCNFKVRGRQSNNVLRGVWTQMHETGARDQSKGSNKKQSYSQKTQQKIRTRGAAKGWNTKSNSLEVSLSKIQNRETLTKTWQDETNWRRTVGKGAFSPQELGSKFSLGFIFQPFAMAGLGGGDFRNWRRSGELRGNFLSRKM